MRMISASATFALLAACNNGAVRDQPMANVAEPGNTASAASPVSTTPAPPAPSGPTTRVGGPPDPAYDANEQRGGISRPLNEANVPFLTELTGRWAHNCNTGSGELIFRGGGRFTAPGGSGRVSDNNYRLTFTFADGETETWTANMTPGRLSLEQRGGGSISRVLCSETP
ncbi:MAG: hypothetical protein AB7O91_05770 [Sphingomonas sp.]